MMKNEVIIIYSQKLAGYLMLNGFKLIDMKRNKNDRNYNVFVFAKTEQLMDSMTKYTEDRAKGDEV